VKAFGLDGLAGLGCCDADLFIYLFITPRFIKAVSFVTLHFFPIIIIMMMHHEDLSIGYKTSKGSAYKYACFDGVRYHRKEGETWCYIRVNPMAGWPSFEFFIIFF